MIAIPGDVFDHDHGVCMRGHGGAGHDLDCRAGFQAKVGGFAGPNLAEDAQAARGVGGAKSESVANTAGGGGHVAVGQNVGGENPSKCLAKGNPLFGRVVPGGSDPFKNDLTSDGEGKSRH